MAKPIFYHGTVKKMIVAFGTIFDEIRFIDGFDREIHVPLHFSSRSKWLEAIQFNTDLDGVIIDAILPRMGFDLVGLAYAPERNLNPLSRIHDPEWENGDTNQFMYNRIPYDFQFELNIAVVRLEDVFKIIEQIVPFFTPELTITVNDMEGLNTPTNVPVVLNSVSLMIENEGSMDSRRIITAQLGFTMKGFLYSNPRSISRIKRTILNMHDNDYNSSYDRFISEVVPFEANKSDPHVIIDRTETVNNHRSASIEAQSVTGQESTTDMSNMILNANSGQTSGASFG